MSTDFFSNQDAARKQTTRLVAFFVLAVIAIVASLYLLAMAVTGYLSADPTGSRAAQIELWISGVVWPSSPGAEERGGAVTRIEPRP